MSPRSAHPLSGKKILIIHFRVGRTDGVSLEIAAWKEILESIGAIVKLCSGHINTGADYTISNLEPQLHPTIFEIDEAAFNNTSPRNEHWLTDTIRSQQEIIIQELNQILNKFRPDRIIVSNIFSVGLHISAAGAFTTVFDQRQIPVLAVHHDFWWEGIRYQKPAHPIVSEQLDQYFPPHRPWLRHATINTLAQTTLKKRKGIDSTLLNDTINFEKGPLPKSQRSTELYSTCSPDKNDLIFLQATRIVRRKNIEVAIDLIKKLSEPENLNRLAQRPLYNNHHFDPTKNKIILTLAGYAEKRDERYRDLLFRYAKEQNVSLCFLGNLINNEAFRGRYSLSDSYPPADFVTYPSESEGFGNQFLEAIHAQKPIAVFEYPVFKTDIAPKGFRFVSLGDSLNHAGELAKIPDKALTHAAQQIIDLLTSPKQYEQTTTTNFAIAKKHFSYTNTRSVLTKLLA